ENNRQDALSVCKRSYCIRKHCVMAGCPVPWSSILFCYVRARQAAGESRIGPDDRTKGRYRCRRTFRIMARKPNRVRHDMDSLATDYAAGTFSAALPPCLSVYQPTHRSHPDNRQDPIRFRNLVKAVEESLQQKYSNRDAAP